ncbi:biotin--[acetyl-CoA-carboxylase] ligase [Pseudosulfitobacter pseudonitzschiae]|uniref:biotin--[acetyl-CoA-carboxylase] ligase n=1 Tax=Pseudosulfitobacter pseudonitzschiae TaxID=1402135 RepID=UPI001AF55EFA|nr:biotin--[acetyl-CoA-carboxylase] ligase [Pseudosulfitobacter pseudonitzschiae]MBM1814354.1 biotin--[acetyl-CoA-carboxylase] ligase [Pseudosulfitobacter pseudonitzschiae]MBM1831347.1 biotin--[acetyl-CoA-carboxylase] ligase [Pseudosulfitobacter pseudonitzschiae]MBM1836214.1 biotin--[acetyl-CoA-carboxylase] ligase [Pseudosulfitobacter pseudonitzschiae]MBM1841060.1 biotin--[acetyl-CoA-carboxylase] ligase [Pseudosulfitobacter pseudonitzschiae]MBM1845928.1 biotin--[acetyl-CoA-carboxylase] ligase 
MTGWPDGYGRRVLQSVDSTLSEAARMAADASGPVWIMAEQQTAARGRRGRPWSMPAGNFAATLLLPVSEAPGQAALRSFVASLALYEALVAATGRADIFALKWPNDVLLRGGKLAGILLESAGQGAQLRHLAIGIGVNLAAAPGADEVEAGAVRPVSLKGELGTVITPEAFLDLLAEAYARFETQFTTYGFAPIRSAWLSHAARLGEVITARTTRDETTGTFADVDSAGNLILETSKGPVPITAAEVYF